MIAESIVFFGLLVSPQKSKGGINLGSSPDAKNSKSNPKPPKTGATGTKTQGALNAAKQIKNLKDMPRKQLEKFDPRKKLQNAKEQLKPSNLLKKGKDEVVSEVKQKVAIALLTNPIFWIVVGVFIFVMFILYIIIGGSQEQQQQGQGQGQQQNPLQVTVTCNPAQIPVGKTSVCTVTVTDSQDADDITVVATIYPFAQYLNNSAKFSSGSSTKAGGTYDATNKTVTWDTQKLKIQLSAPITQTFMLTVTKIQKIDAVPIVVTANGAGSAGGAGGSGIPPNTNTCNGKYTADLSKNWLLKKNFGDPQCTMPDNNNFAAYLKSQDPTNGAKWFVVAQCESGYDPNVWRDPNEIAHTPDASGAWGLFQIGSSAIMTPESLYTSNRTATVTNANVKQPPGLPMPTWGHGGQYDRGDTDWETQVQDAINLLKQRGWGYWGCA